MTVPSAGGPAPGRRAAAALAVATVGLSWIWLAWPWLSGAVTVPWDAKAHFQPQLQFLAGSIHAGESPFWNPYVFAGWPQVADPQSLVFVPAFLILALFDPAPSFVAMDATVYAALLAGGIGLALWGRDRGWHPAAAAVAALSFAFGGSAAWRIQHTGQVLSYALIPIAMLLLARALDRRSIGWGAAAGLVAGFLALGRDQVALLGIYLLVGQAAVAILAGDGLPGGSLTRRIAAAAGPLAAGAVVGLAVTVLPIALTLILAQESNRPAIDYIGAGMGSLHPASLITIVNADLFGQGAQDVDYWGPPSVPFGVTNIYLAQNMGAIYAGAAPMVAILMLGVARGLLWRRDIRFFTIAALLTILYAIGWYTPFFKLAFDWLPGVKLYRRPADATFMIGFFVALLGGHCIDRWIAGGLPPAGRIARIAQAAIVVVVLAVLPAAFALHADRVAEAVRPTAVAAAFFAAAVAVLWLARRCDARAPALPVLLLVAFTAFDLGRNNAPNESTAYPPSMFEALKPDGRDPVILDLKRRVAETTAGARRDRVELLGLGFHWPNAGMVHRLDHDLGYNPLRFRTYQAATGAQDTVGLPDQRAFNAMFPGYGSTMARLIGLRWIASSVPLDTVDPRVDPDRIVEVARLGGTRIYENRDALPRALFVTRARQADVARLLETGQWPEGFDPAREVVLDAVPAGNSRPADGPGGSVSIAAYHNTEVVLDVDAGEAGWVVLGDVWHRWWRAELDGKPAELQRANAIFRAVAVPAGRHTVRFSFHPFAGAWADIRAALAARR